MNGFVAFEPVNAGLAEMRSPSTSAFGLAGAGVVVTGLADDPEPGPGTVVAATAAGDAEIAAGSDGFGVAVVVGTRETTTGGVMGYCVWAPTLLIDPPTSRIPVATKRRVRVQELFTKFIVTQGGRSVQ